MVRSGIAYVRSCGGIVRKVVDSAREHGAARYVVPPRARTTRGRSCISTNSGACTSDCWKEKHRVELLLLATSDGSRRAREIAEPASRAGSVDGRIETRPLDEALEKLVDHAYVLAPDQRLTSERARRILGWTPSAPSVFEELEGGSYS